MDRGTYYQTSYLIGKGRDEELRRHDVQWLPDRLPVPMRLLRRVPPLRTVTGYLGGFGIRPEHAPGFARVSPGARSRRG